MRVWALASGLALAVRTAGLAEVSGVRAGPEDRFCEAVRNDLWVPLSRRGQSGQCAAFRPGTCDLLSGDRAVQLARPTCSLASLLLNRTYRNI